MSAAVIQLVGDTRQHRPRCRPRCPQSFVRTVGVARIVESFFRQRKLSSLFDGTVPHFAQTSTIDATQQF